MTGMTSDNRTGGAVGVLPDGLVVCADGLVRSHHGTGPVVPKWRYDLSERVPQPSMANRVASWLVWHFWEVAGVTVWAAVAVAVTPWAWVVSGAVAAGWSVHAIRFAREQARVAAPVRRASTEHGSDVDETPDGPAPDTNPANPADIGGSVADSVAGGVA
jgi:hypothetical protein